MRARYRSSSSLKASMSSSCTRSMRRTSGSSSRRGSTVTRGRTLIGFFPGSVADPFIDILLLRALPASGFSLEDRGQRSERHWGAAFFCPLSSDSGGQIDVERAALALDAVDLDGPAHQVEVALDDGQPQPGVHP